MPVSLSTLRQSDCACKATPGCVMRSIPKRKNRERVMPPYSGVAIVVYYTTGRKTLQGTHQIDSSDLSVVEQGLACVLSFLFFSTFKFTLVDLRG